MKLARRDVLIGLGLASVTVGGGSFLACRNDGTDPPDRGKILVDVTNDVIVPAYSDSVTDAAALATAVAALRDAPTAAALTSARTAWKKARTTWKVTDAFVFGPSENLELTGGVIDYAGNRDRIEKTLAGADALDAKAVSNLGADQRGFGALEVLLFDPARDEEAILATFGSAGSRRGVYAGFVADDLTAKITAVRDAWSNGYATELSTAGRGSTTYSKESQGIDELVNALVNCSEIIITLHLAKPLGIDKATTPQPDLVESPHADHSTDDLLAELAGIEAVYLGTRNGASGLPLADAVKDRNPTADANMRDALAKAKSAVVAIPGPLRTAVVERRDPVLAAHAACREVKRALALQVASALGTSLGFTVTDGD